MYLSAILSPLQHWERTETDNLSSHVHGLRPLRGFHGAHVCVSIRTSSERQRALHCCRGSLSTSVCEDESPSHQQPWELWIPAIKSRAISASRGGSRSGFPSAISLWVWYLPFPTLGAYSLAQRRGQKKCVLLHITLATVFDLMLKGGRGSLSQTIWPGQVDPEKVPATFSTNSAHTNSCERLLWHLRHDSSTRQHAPFATAEVGHVCAGCHLSFSIFLKTPATQWGQTRWNFNEAFGKHSGNN